MPGPRPTGDRLCLIVGHSLPAATFAGAERVVVDPGLREGRPPVLLLDTGDALVLLRHGIDGFVPAHRIDHHAHIAALCTAGVGRVVALGSVGSLRTDWPPGTVVCPDDLFAPAVTPTYETGASGHGIPHLDPAWRSSVLDAWRSVTDEPIHDGGTYAQTTGPRFETPAEIRFLATHADVVGMTVASEAFLASEVRLPYAAVCVVDNLANGLDAVPLTMDDYRSQKSANEAMVSATVTGLVRRLASS